MGHCAVVLDAAKSACSLFTQVSWEDCILCSFCSLILSLCENACIGIGCPHCWLVGSYVVSY